MDLHEIVSIAVLLTFNSGNRTELFSRYDYHSSMHSFSLFLSKIKYYYCNNIVNIRESMYHIIMSILMKYTYNSKLTIFA